MVFKLTQSAENRWRNLRGFKLLADIIDGIKFVDDEKKETDNLDIEDRKFVIHAVSLSLEAVLNSAPLTPIIVLFGKDKVNLEADFKAGKSVQLGEQIGQT